MDIRILREILQEDPARAEAQLDGIQAELGHYSEVLRQVYEDPSLASEREELLRATLDLEGNLGTLDILDARLVGIMAIRLLLGDLMPLEGAKDLVRLIQDGDLAYSTWSGEDLRAPHGTVLGDTDYEDFFGEMRFSPELQVRIATAEPFASLPLSLAKNIHLTEEAQKLLLTHPDFRVRLAIMRNPTFKVPFTSEAFEGLGREGRNLQIRFLLSENELSETMQSSIEGDPLLQLVLRARKDAQAECELIEIALLEETEADRSLLSLLAAKLPLHSERAYELLLSSSCASLARMNLEYQNRPGDTEA